MSLNHAEFRTADDQPVPGRGARTEEGWVAVVRDPDLPESGR